MELDSDRAIDIEGVRKIGTQRRVLRGKEIHIRISCCLTYKYASKRGPRRCWVLFWKRGENVFSRHDAIDSKIPTIVGVARTAGLKCGYSVVVRESKRLHRNVGSRHALTVEDSPAKSASENQSVVDRPDFSRVDCQSLA